MIRRAALLALALATATLAACSSPTAPTSGVCDHQQGSNTCK